jgi:hypothetical protein
MAKKIELPEQEIIELYKTNVWYSISRLAKKFKTTEYRVRKLLDKAGVLRKTAALEKLLVSKYLKYERQFGNDAAKELYHARELLFHHPEEAFWQGFELGFKLNSLAFFQSDKGQGILQKKYAEFKFELPVNPSHNIGPDKVGEDAEVVSKPKSIHEFLRR